MRRFASILLSAAVLTGSLVLPAAAAPGFSGFRGDGSYTDAVFSDAPGDDAYVAAVYELGLMRGDGQGRFDGGGALRQSEALVLACRLHSLYHTGEMDFPAGDPWYQPYVDYALSAGLLAAAPQDLTGYESRGHFAALLARALPEGAFPALNRVEENALPDVAADDPNAGAVYLLCRAGVLCPENGAFLPDAAVTHDYAAGAAARAAYRSLRQRYTLEKAPEPPAVTPAPAAQPLTDEELKECALLGNALAQGLGFYTSLGSLMHVSADQYATVGTAGELVESLEGQKLRRVYLEFGVNEIAMTPENFRELYSGLIDQVRSAVPDATVCVMSLTPVTEERDGEGVYTMERIRAWNDLLRDLCQEKDCRYLDCCGPLSTAEGWLREEYAGWDGSPHLSREAYLAWEQVIRND